MRPHATGLNPLSNSIICPYIHPVIRGPFETFFNINLQCGGPAPWCIYLCPPVAMNVKYDLFMLNNVHPHTGFWRNPVGFSWYYMSVPLSLSLCPVVRVGFWWSFARPIISCSACGCSPRGLNTLSGGIIYPSAHPSSCPREFCDFYVYNNIQCGGPASWCIFIDKIGIYKIFLFGVT